MANQKNEQKKPQNRRNLVELAKKKRQIWLLDKLQKGKPLSASELKELERLEGGELQPGTLRTQEEVGQALHVSARTVRNWVKEGLPKTPEGYYSLLEILAWQAVKDKKGAAGDEKEKQFWEIEYRKYKAKLAELELKKAYGLVLDKEEVEKGQVARILAVKQTMFAVPRTAAPVIAPMDNPREIEAYLRGLMRYICEQFASRK
ncbi:MAG: hypothetical protein JW734_06510 [Candidatus Omnitrophica bacterium]|nr:hypothetical protein [Candidatus Omnitrophota bacterium]